MSHLSSRARPLRLELPGVLYHIAACGKEREPIVTDATDLRHYVDALAREIAARDLTHAAGFQHLPCGPQGCRVFCDIEMQNLPPVVLKTMSTKKIRKVAVGTRKESSEMRSLA